MAAVGLWASGCASAPAKGANVSQGANGSGVIFHTPQDTSPYHGTEERRYELPDVTLTADSGRPFNLAADTDKPVTLVFFGYTHCPDICPVTVAHVTQALRQAPDSVRHKVQFVFITTDPARDSQQRLRTWLGRFSDSYVGLTGDLDTISKTAKQLGVPIGDHKKLPSGGYTVNHGAQLLAFGPHGDSRVLWTAGTPVGALSSDLVQLVHSAARA